MAWQVKYEGVMIHKHIRMLYLVMLKLKKASFSFFLPKIVYTVYAKNIIPVDLYI